MFKHLKEFRKQLGIEESDEYIGNMWGWKVSYIGLAVLIFLIALYFYRATYHPQKVTGPSPIKIEDVR
ncbi:MAG: hypothetical protein AAF960_27250 [Bacteroidota bacterium]